MTKVTLPTHDGDLEVFVLEEGRPDAQPMTWNRTAYAAAHVIADPLKSDEPWAGGAVDWEATLKFRQYLWDQGFGVAEAMDTAQRGSGLDWPTALQLIQRSVALARQTGGLLREPALLQTRDDWQAHNTARDALLARLGVSAHLTARLRRGARLAVLFCYPQAPIHALLAGLSQAGPAVLLVPDDVAPTLTAGPHGQVHVVRIPFVPQADFDRLLWSADLNLVRGEDSFVRALWAGRPLLWHIYPQENDAHLGKLNAWLARCQVPAPVAALMRHWNGVAADTLPHTLATALAPSAWRDWQTHARAVSLALAEPPDLADALVDFCTRIDAGALPEPSFFAPDQ